jgi:ubiquinone/menaquinone biosynthesis C-methylase UbiE
MGGLFEWLLLHDIYGKELFPIINNNGKKNIDILKTLIISVKRINKLEYINKQIQEKEIIKISKYVLFNILSNEYIEIN